MKRIIPPLAAVAGVAMTTAILGAPAAATPVEWTETTADVHAFADPEPRVGTSTLRRNDDAIAASFSAGGVAPGQAVTLWWVVFNDPAGCSAPGCGEDDIFVGGDPAAGLDADAVAEADVVAGYAAGTITSADGTYVVAARLTEGEPGAEVIVGEGAVLKDAATAEVHLIVRSHGPAVAGLEASQTTTHGGGCETNLNPPEIADAEGECADIQFSVHQP